MPDHDLGVAHGKIEIESDVNGLNKTIAQMAALKAAIKSVEKPLGELDDAMDKVSQRSSVIASSLSKLQSATVSVGRGVGQMSSTLARATGITKAYDSAMSDLTGTMMSLYRAGSQVHDVVNGLRSPFSTVGGMLRNQLLFGLTGINREMNNFPRSVQNIAKVATAITAAGAATLVFRKGLATAGLGLYSFAARSTKIRDAMIGIELGFRNATGPGGRFEHQMNMIRSASEKANGSIRGFYRNLSTGAKGVTQLITGAALLTSGFRQLGNTIGPVIKMLMSPKGLMGLGAAAAGLAALKPAAGIITGLVDALGQLSGAALIVPGILASAGVAGAVMAVAFKGVSEAFKTAAMDGEEYEKAVAKLPEGMQNVARTAHGFRDELKAIKQEIQDTTFKGFSNQLQAMGDNYLPVVSVGARRVAESLNMMVLNIMKFVNESQTVTDVNSLFGFSAQTTKNFAGAASPILAVLRDIGTVGAEVFAELTTGIGASAERFSNFISAARESGELRNWIEEGIEGFSDLGSTVRDVSVGIHSLFEAFGGSGENALGRMAEGAEKFRAAMESPAADSGLAQAIDMISASADRAKTLITTVFDALLPSIQSAGAFLKEFSDGFTGRFIQSFEMFGTVIHGVAAALNELSFLGTIIGSVLGAAAAMKVLLLILGPVTAAVKMFVGAFMIGGGISKIMFAAALAVETMAARLGVAGTASRVAAGGFLLMATTLTGPVLGALVAVGAALALMKMSSDEHVRTQKTIADSYKEAGDAARGFADEVMKANGVVSGAALDKMATSVGKLRDAWKAQGEDGPSFMDRVGSWVSGDVSKDTKMIGDRDEKSTVKIMEENRDRALEMEAALDGLRITNDDVARAISGSAGDWDNFKASLQAAGTEGARIAAEELQKFRDEAVHVKDIAHEIGPAALEVSNGLKVIADESSSASDKLNALMSVMRGLGLIESSAEEAAFRLAGKLSEVVVEATNLIDASGAMGMALVGTDGKLKANEANGRALYDQLVGLRQEYYNTVAAGGDANAKFQEMLPTLIALGEKYGFTAEELQTLITKYGFVPTQIETIMSVQGVDGAVEDLKNIQLRMGQLEGKGKVRIDIDTVQAYNALQAFGVQISEFDPKTGSAIIEIPPGLGPETNAKIQAILDGLPGVKPKVEPPAPGEIPPVPISAEMVEADRLRVLAQQEALLTGGKMEITPEIVEADKQNVLQIQRDLLTTPMEAPVVPEIDVQNLEDFKGKVDEAKSQLDSLNGSSATASVTLEGADAIIGALQGVNNALAESSNMFAQYVSAIGASMEAARSVIETMAGILVLPLNTAAVQATASGMSLGQGFADGISSKADVVRAAALKLAEAASQPLPRSPAKIGPFSGRGWTPFRGVSLAEGFAKGIIKATPLAENASLGMAVAVADAMDSIRAEFNMPGTSFSANTFAPGSKSYYRDPEISDESLAEAREKRRKDKEAADAKQARKDAQSAANKMPSAEEKVVKANERIQKAEERIAKAQQRIGEAKTDKARQSAEESLATANESLNEAKIAKTEAEENLKRVSDTAGGLTADGVKGGLTPNRDRTDYINAMNDIAKTFGLEMTSGVREGDPGHHGSGRAADFSNGSGNTDQQLAFAEFMNANFKPYIKELIYDDPRFSGKEIKDGKTVDSSFYDGAGDHTNHVHLAVDFAPEFSTGTNAPSPVSTSSTSGSTTTTATVDPTRTDLTKDQVAAIIIARGRAMGMSDSQIESALATGMVEAELQNLDHGPDGSRGAFQQRDSDEWTKGGSRNRMNVDDAATSYFEHLAEVDPSLSPGDQAQAVQRSAYPGKYAERLPEAQAMLDAFGSGTGTGTLSVHDSDLNETEADALTRLKANNESLSQALMTAQNPNASDADVVRALNTIDQSMTGLDETDKELLDTQKQAIMEDRGIKEYDPFEGKIEPGGEFDFALQTAQMAVGLFHTLEDGLKNMEQTGSLLVRGVSNTKEVNSLIDGFQGMASTIGEVVSAVGSIVNVVATVAATAGAAIPGIGQVGAVVSGITGGIANVNAVIDLVQDVMHVVGRIGGGILSSIAGGENGQLMGNVRTLLDSNDGTIKTWSDRNPAEKTVHGLPWNPGRDPNQASTVRDLNIYQGPGGDPRQAMDAAMFAVRAHSQGVFAG